MASYQGRFIWYENLTRDVPAAVAFYKAVAGWTTQVWDGAGEPYHMLVNGEVPFAGLHPMPPTAEAPPHWLGYIGTPDVKATTELAESLGAKIWMRLLEVPTVGTMSIMQDPQGASFAAYTPVAAADCPTTPAGMGEFAWHELATTDIDAAFGFYQQLFGWEKQEVHDMGHMGLYVEYGVPGLALGGIYVKPAEMPGPPSWLYYVRVADLDAGVGRVKGHGGSVLLEPIEVPGGDRVAVFADPQGAPFAFYWKKNS